MFRVTAGRLFILRDFRRTEVVVPFTGAQHGQDVGPPSHTFRLARIADPERPVQVVIIGIGGDVSRTELEAITKVTGGGVFVSEDPNKIGETSSGRSPSVRSRRADLVDHRTGVHNRWCH